MSLRFGDESLSKLGITAAKQHELRALRDEIEGDVSGWAIENAPALIQATLSQLRQTLGARPCLSNNGVRS